MSFIGLFLEGLLSFLSPCVLPLLPLYMSYIAGDGKRKKEDGTIVYDQKKVFVSTIFFVFGISVTFLLLALSIELLNDFLNHYSKIISIIGGSLLIVFGFYNLGIVHIGFLSKEYKWQVPHFVEKFQFLKSFFMGLLFSIGWSPCIGPMLSSALLLAATSNLGYLYILVYACGLIIPFLITGLLTSTILNFIEKKKKIIAFTGKVAGVLLICFGLVLIYNGIKEETVETSVQEETSEEELDLLNHEFKDQDGNVVKLSDYKGNYVMMDFIATWCHYCVEEIPLYQEYATKKECVCLYVMTPGYNSEKKYEKVLEFIEENNIKLIVIVDEEKLLASYFGVSSYPTKFIMDDSGTFVSYVSGAFSDVSTYSDFLEYAKSLSASE